jgi:hypothetical protein
MIAKIKPGIIVFDNDVSNWWIRYDCEVHDNEEGTPNQEPFYDGEATCIFKVGS